MPADGGSTTPPLLSPTGSTGRPPTGTAGPTLYTVCSSDLPAGQLSPLGRSQAPSALSPSVRDSKRRRQMTLGFSIAAKNGAEDLETIAEEARATQAAMANEEKDADDDVRRAEERLQLDAMQQATAGAASKAEKGSVEKSPLDEPVPVRRLSASTGPTLSHKPAGGAQTQHSSQSTAPSAAPAAGRQTSADGVAPHALPMTPLVEETASPLGSQASWGTPHMTQEGGVMRFRSNSFAKRYTLCPSVASQLGSFSGRGHPGTPGTPGIVPLGVGGSPYPALQPSSQHSLADGSPNPSRAGHRDTGSDGSPCAARPPADAAAPAAAQRAKPKQQKWQHPAAPGALPTALPPPAAGHEPVGHVTRREAIRRVMAAAYSRLPPLHAAPPPPHGHAGGRRLSSRKTQIRSRMQVYYGPAAWSDPPAAQQLPALPGTTQPQWRGAAAAPAGAPPAAALPAIPPIPAAAACRWAPAVPIAAVDCSGDCDALESARSAQTPKSCLKKSPKHRPHDSPRPAGADGPRGRLAKPAIADVSRTVSCPAAKSLSFSI